MNKTPSCSFCPNPATRELRTDVFACSPECEEVWASQFCACCGCNEAEGEQHAEVCNDVFYADRFADDSGPIVAGEFDDAEGF